ncbi:MAG: hypothetical protein CFE43_00080 [Burkholderiales bacterium PBB3]|nr:MAG: hypothetical protein CFE43_00080 [Burkholderiales bacterium PBB3]
MTVRSGFQACLLVLVAAVHGPAQAQVATSNDYSQASRADIEAARRAQAQTFDERARSCEAAFAVTQCLTRVRSERLAAQANLDRRERQLNDIQRSSQAQEQLERSQQKQAEHEAKLNSQARAAAERRTVTLPIAAKGKPSGTPFTAKAEPSPQLSAAQRSANRQEFQRKQQDAEARRKAVDARVKANKKPAATLPLPP